MTTTASSIPMPPNDFIQAVGGGDFQAIGQHFFQIFVNHVGVKPDHNVLDVGSGCGRLAIPLTTYLAPSAEYHGVDIVKAMVEWCQENITSRFPNFKFHHAELTNTLYSKGGASASQYKFPFPDQKFDFVFLTSVFTHLNPEDADNYLKEIQRVLKPDARVLMSFYLMTGEYARNRKKKRAHVTFDHGQHPYWVNDPKVPEAVSAYDEAYILEKIRSAGLSIDAVYYGGWNGHRGMSFQDIIVASRKD